MSQVRNIGVVFTTPNSLPGEGTSQSTSVDGILPLNSRLYSENAESLLFFSGTGSDAGVGSSGVANRAPPINQLGNLSCTTIGVEELICLQ
ncbi:hypothetical protein OIU79_024194 [Salix purpurea]|uniref:Uncharacterized protein n=1 Tax=Salix purpurea TaxID=77065 RepID=A0A9Q0WAE9_SALPP|nr:hypothetical protein OIU79_024194 [Salix purpurea]